MFAEISTIIGVLNGINSAVKTLKEAGGNIEQAHQVLGRMQSTNDRLDRWERKKLAKRALTSSESIKLASCRAKARQAEADLRSHFLMLPGGRKIWSDAMRIKVASEKAREEYMKTVAHRRAERNRMIRGVTIGVFIVATALVMVIATYLAHPIWQEMKLDRLKNDLKIKQMRLENIRKCGRTRC